MILGMQGSCGSFPAPTLTIGTPQSSTSNVTVGNTYTFAGVSIGAASSTRLVVLTVAIRGGATVNAGGLTIGGIVATRIRNGFDAQIWAAIVPTGTTADIVVTVASATAINIAVGVYILTNLRDPSSNYTSAIDTNAASHTSLSVSVGIPPKGIAIFCSSRTGTGGVTWTGASEDYDSVVETNAGRSFASIDNTASFQGSDATVTATYSAATGANLVAAVWR